MNKYHCTKCNKEIVTASHAKELSLKCCDKDTPTLHKQGAAPAKEAKTVAAPVKPSTPAK